MPINFINVGEKAIISKIIGDEKTKQHLSELGFTFGTQVQIISKIADNVIIQVKESRIALDKTMANKIIVKF